MNAYEKRATSFFIFVIYFKIDFLLPKKLLTEIKVHVSTKPTDLMSSLHLNFVLKIEEFSFLRFFFEKLKEFKK